MSRLDASLISLRLVSGLAHSRDITAPECEQRQGGYADCRRKYVREEVLDETFAALQIERHIHVAGNRPGCLAGVRCSSRTMNRLSSRCYMK
ncbi:hypothetical protein [Mesorhizobium sp. WSM3860]|uniref:hypothetical protein n=1 Tax=Mesorhizobium sp. WSM3860 TaxID=2029403 RepID=UPI001140A32D|nr:hypothetical protein [Mesorhizobium sp. WSM3860]